ncbi:DUF2726 domain-containing protein [Ideonella sp.]|uniref:DUF2726 domain-containing protein n=1 Tax=Ideonella sp. TaxID=1929293 RepID=UPI0035AE8BD0
MNALPWILLGLTVGVGAPALWWWLRQRDAQAAVASRARVADARDTVADWPPTATRLLTAPERQAHQLLSAALPDQLVFAQVPLARFLRVPTRYSYGDWLARVGQLSVDLLVCDRSTAVLAAVEIRPAETSTRSLARHKRMARVLEAAGVRVVVWQEGAMPSATQAIRDELLPPELARLPVAAPAPRPPAPAPLAPASPLTRIPVGHVQAPGEASVPLPDPPPTTWFSEIDAPPAPSAPSAPPRPPAAGR